MRFKKINRTVTPRNALPQRSAECAKQKKSMAPLLNPNSRWIPPSERAISSGHRGQISVQYTPLSVGCKQIARAIRNSREESTASADARIRAAAVAYRTVHAPVAAAGFAFFAHLRCARDRSSSNAAIDKHVGLQL